MSLILHCGAHHIDRAGLATLPAPVAQGPTHRPLHHADYVELVSDHLADAGFALTDEAFGVTPDGDRFFGLMQVEHEALAKYRGTDIGFALGLRGSHDQVFGRGLAFGATVFVCDNLSFSGSVQFTTKHTTNLLDRLPGMIAQACDQILPQAEHQMQRFETYKATPITSDLADAALTQIIRAGVVLPTESARLIHEWDEPSHEEFDEPNIWRLFNAATEVLKPRSERTRLPTLAAKTAKLHNICDRLALVA